MTLYLLFFSSLIHVSIAAPTPTQYSLSAPIMCAGCWYIYINIYTYVYFFFWNPSQLREAWRASGQGGGEGWGGWGTVREGVGEHFESPERGGGGRGRSQRDFSCPGQKKKSGPGSPRPTARPPRLSHLASPLPLSLSQSPTFLTQLPAVTAGDMCHITSTCVHRVGGWGGGPTGGLSWALLICGSRGTRTSNTWGGFLFTSSCRAGK